MLFDAAGRPMLLPALRPAVNPRVSAFSPLDLTPTGWWDFSDEATVTLNGSDISQIDDKSGNSRHMGQSVAVDQPEYLTAAAGVNGLRCAQLTDAGDEHIDEVIGAWGDANDLYDAAGADGFTQVVVMEVDSLSSAGTILTELSTFKITLQLLSTDFEFRVLATGDNVNATAPEALGVKTLIGRYDGAATGGTGRLRVNGSETTETGNRPIALTTAPSFGEAAFSFQMKLCEIITFDRELTAAECLQIENYTNKKWGAS